MRVYLEIADGPRWERFWRDLATLGELGPREAVLLADAGRRGLALNWERESSPDGGRWVDLRPFTQRERRRLGFAARHPILQRTGDLKESFTEPGHSRHIYQVGHWDGSTVVVIGARENPATPGRIPLLNNGGAIAGPLVGMPAGGAKLERYMSRGGVTRGGRRVAPRPFIGFSETATRWIEWQADAIILQRVARLGR